MLPATPAHPITFAALGPTFLTQRHSCNKVKSQACHNKKHQDARASSATPILKQLHQKRCAQGKDSSIAIDINASALVSNGP
jgi:hypothetical protein